MTEIKNVPAGQRMPIPNWVVADETARLALSLVAADNYKCAYQLDNDTVWILKDYSGPTWIELTNVATAQLPDIGILSLIPGSSYTTTSGSYADIASGVTEVAFTKVDAGSDIVVEIDLTAYSTAVNTIGKIGVYDGTTDHDVMQIPFSPATTFVPFSGKVKISGLAAGSYTFEARWKRTTGSGTITLDTNGMICMSVQEVAG